MEQYVVGTINTPLLSNEDSSAQISSCASPKQLTDTTAHKSHMCDCTCVKTDDECLAHLSLPHTHIHTPTDLHTQASPAKNVFQRLLRSRTLASVRIYPHSAPTDSIENTCQISPHSSFADKGRFFNLSLQVSSDKKVYSTDNASSAENLSPKNQRSRKSQIKPQYMKYRRKFPVLDICAGVVKTTHMQTPELLRCVHFCNKDRHLEDTLSGSLKLRDLRQVCSVGSFGVFRPSIETRRNCILVNIPPIRCLILHNRVLVIPSDYGSAMGNDSELDSTGLVEKFKHLSEMKTIGPFEFAALEAILINMCSKLNKELLPLKESVDILSNDVNHSTSSNKLKDITQLKRKLDNMTDKLKGCQTALKEILDNEDDLLKLEISRFWDSPHDWANPTPSSSAEDLEILLECYEQEVESLLRQCVRADETLDDALQIMELQLNSLRNSFLKAELGLDIVGTAIAVVAAVAGIFGMNIQNGFEKKENLFWSMTSGMTGMCLLVVLCVSVIFRRLRL